MKNTQDFQKENELLRQQVEKLRSEEEVIHQFDGVNIRFGVIGDTHLGSLYSDLSVLRAAYRMFAQSEVHNVYHAGDILDGEKIYRGQEYELRIHGADAQVAYCVKNYPKVDGITTHFICGNHDYSFYKRSGLDPGNLIAAQRSDMVYLGPDEQDVILRGEGKTKAVLRLVHPRKGTAYALSYQIQKMIEAWSGGNKPAIVVVGHYHKSEYIFYRNVHAFQVGTTQQQTPFMRGQNIAAMLGFWIVEVTLSSRGISQLHSTFYPFY